MALITLSRLTWCTPDGRKLFYHMDFHVNQERLGLVGRNGVGKSTLLQILCGQLAHQAGSVVMAGTCSLLRQTVQCGELETIAQLFGVAEDLSILERAESGDATIGDLSDADWTLEERIAGSLARVGLDVPPQTLLKQLSGGERTRASLAAAIFREPDVLLLDEPTNNLDRAGRVAVIKLLAKWRSAAIVASHDRELLEQMDAIVELTSLGATRYGGNWSHYRARKQEELEAAQSDLAHAEKKVAEVSRKAQAALEHQARRDAAGTRKAGRGDIPKLLLGTRKNNAEASRGDKVRLAGHQRAQALETLSMARTRVEILDDLSFQLPPTDLAAHRIVLQLEEVTAGYDIDHPVIRDLTFSVVGPERVAITGPNGSGKTTLVQLLAGQMQPFRGTVSVTQNFSMLDQSAELLVPGDSILENFMRLNPTSNENACRAALAHFLFKSKSVFQRVETLSGGQMFRAALACILGGKEPPSLLILDEPTNHLDIDSVESIERALGAYDGAIVVVSHDETFLSNISITRRIDLGSRDALGLK